MPELFPCRRFSGCGSRSHVPLAGRLEPHVDAAVSASQPPGLNLVQVGDPGGAHDVQDPGRGAAALRPPAAPFVVAAVKLNGFGVARSA